MHIEDLGGDGHSFRPNLLPHYEAAFCSVGRPTFGRELFGLARAATGCDQIIIFHGPPGRPQSCYMRMGTRMPPLWRNRKYLDYYWKNDPLSAYEAHKVRDGRSMVLLDREQIPDAEYRDDCFVAENLKSRASVLHTQDSITTRFNIYFEGDGAFSSNTVSFLSESADVLYMLLKRDGIGAAVHAPGTGQEDMRERLDRLALGLTRREIEVCVNIARGLTSEGIALELGISINTVLTYRKRAYARLRISSQNELMRLLVA